MKTILSKWANYLIGLPSFAWLIIFYALPTIIVFLFTFKPVDSNGGIGNGWTLDTLMAMSNPSYPSIIWRTIWQGVVSTLICIAIAVPISYQLARTTSKKMKNTILMLIVVPFWTNFLIRIYAWKVFLHPDGYFKQLLVLIGLLPQDATLLYNQWAVLTVMVYTYIPFAVLPIYAVAEKFDFSLLDAAKDLGASSFYAFRRIFIPAISTGIGTAVMVVLIPALGAYLIPDLVGGPSSELLGDKIAQRVFTDRNLPHASALSCLLMIGVYIPLIVWYFVSKRIAAKNDKKSTFKVLNGGIS